MVGFKNDYLVANRECGRHVMSLKLLARAIMECRYDANPRKVAADHVNTLASLLFDFFLKAYLFFSLPQFGFSTDFG